MITVGVDPGAKGALAWYDDTKPQMIHVMDMPIIGNEVAPALLISHLRPGDGLPDWVYIERVSAMPKQGVSSTFKFGVSYGMVRGVMAALAVPCVLITPQTWKKHHGLIGQDKDQSRAKAVAIWPAYADLFKRKKDDGRSEAALLALYGAREQARLSGVAA